MKPLLFILFFCSNLFSAAYANNIVSEYAPSKECKTCHSQIYDEFYSSMHANSTPQKDPIHASVWNRHPKNLKLNQYACGKCHTPAANNLDKMLTKGQKALPSADNATHQEGISCAYCHRIESIKLASKSNINVMSEVPKKYFGTTNSQVPSPFHDTLKTDNSAMKNGNVCVGCHSHKKNKHGLNVCSTNINNEMDGANCVSCHMPKVTGKPSALSQTKAHSFHGFPGAHQNLDMLTKYVDISLLREINNFKVNIDNQSSHALLLHPLRVAVLKVKVIRGDKEIALPEQYFKRVIGVNGKPAMPWLAKKEVANTMIQANEKRVVNYDFSLQKRDEVEVVLGWYLVNPKAVAKLNLSDEKVATQFMMFKQQSFPF